MLVNNLVRMSQGKMMGVDFNKEKTWVGSSIALHATLALVVDPESHGRSTGTPRRHEDVMCRTVRDRDWLRLRYRSGVQPS